jgi:hypothetical protein
MRGWRGSTEQRSCLRRAREHVSRGIFGRVYVGWKLTLGHAQVSPHDEDELALLFSGVYDGRLFRLLFRLALLRRGLRLHGLDLGLGLRGRSLLRGGLLLGLPLPLAEAVATVGVEAVGPIRRVVEVCVILVDVGLVALERVVEVGVTLRLELWRDKVSAAGVEAESEACEEGDGARDNDDVKSVGHDCGDGLVGSQVR